MKMNSRPGVAAALAGCGLWVAALPTAIAAGPGIAVVSVRAMVSPTVAMKFESGSTRLSVNEDDIARGYIDVPSTSRLTLNSDKNAQQIANLTIDYEPSSSGFSSIQLAAQTLPARERDAGGDIASFVDTLPATAAGPAEERDADSGRLVDALPATAAAAWGGAGRSAPSDTATRGSDGTQPGQPRSSVTALGYRLMLPKGIKPGDISVPLTLNLQL